VPKPGIGFDLQCGEGTIGLGIDLTDQGSRDDKTADGDQQNSSETDSRKHEAPSWQRFEAEVEHCKLSAFILPGDQIDGPEEPQFHLDAPWAGLSRPTHTRYGGDALIVGYILV
jgi:hypothetical protein